MQFYQAIKKQNQRKEASSLVSCQQLGDSQDSTLFKFFLKRNLLMNDSHALSSESWSPGCPSLTWLWSAPSATLPLFHKKVQRKYTVSFEHITHKTLMLTRRKKQYERQTN